MTRIQQIPLVTGIMKLLEKQGMKDANVRQINCVIAAANAIVKEFETPHKYSVPGMGLASWLDCDDTGTSSRFMAFRLAAGPLFACSHPFDPSDFGRCYRFLRAVPEIDAAGRRTRDPVSEMAPCSAIWTALAGSWEELEKLWEEESPTGKCPKLFARMQEIIKGAEGK